MKWLSNHRKKWLVLAIVLALPMAFHAAVRQHARVLPPPIDVDEQRVVRSSDGTLSYGQGSVRRHGDIWEVSLSGTPEQIGYAHARLLHEQMVANESVLLGHFERTVPNRLARTLLLDLALAKYGSVSDGMSPPRLRELAAMARGFDPDPYAGFFDTFQRFVYLNALYDISLSFEHSPLLGCTSFVLNATKGGTAGPLLARNFDFEVDPIFDREKAVFLVRETGKLPFASVAWPGLVGVVSGMNASGVAVVVHGARAAAPANSGEPVVHALRRVLSTAETTEQAVARLAERPVMVSHIVIIVDANGSAVAVERAPGHPDYVRKLRSNAAITNHFEGPLADDERNQRVKRETSTLQRRKRADELVSGLRDNVRVPDAVALLRDKKGAGGKPLELGDRNAIDALIATHGVVMDTRAGQLWVSEGPHLLGKFVLFDVKQLFENPDSDSFDSIAADPLLEDGHVQQRLGSSAELQN